MNPHSESAYFLNPLMRIFLQSLIEYVENLVPVDIIPDFNRDGQINADDKNKVTEAEPFRWWINDDDDTTEARGVGDTPGQASPDYANTKVDSSRDLVDFFPLHIDLKDMLKDMPADKFEYYLAHDGGAFNFFEAVDIKSDGTNDVNGSGAFIRNLSLAQTYGEKSVQQITSEGTKLSNELLAAIRGYESGVVLLEGRSSTQEPIKLKVKPIGGGDLITIAEFPVSISGVEEMFRYVNLRGLAGGDIGTHASRKGQPSNYSDSLTNGKYVAQMHGFNVDAKNGRGWSAEVFKRLHQLGSQARFIGMAWHGNPSSDIPYLNLDYHQAVYNAFKTSKSLASELSFASGDLTIIGHSLANMVISSAVKDYGFTPNRYFIVNGAVPIEAFDPDQTAVPDVDSMELNMTEAEWIPYDRKFYASSWHELFASSDNRSQLTWKNQFSGVSSVAYNFYSPGDEVVSNSPGGETVTIAIIDQIGSVTQGTGGLKSHTWVFQELAKGGKNILPPYLFYEPQGGWGFHYNPPSLTNTPTPWEQGYWKDDNLFLQTKRMYTNAEALAEISDDDLKEKPFFYPFENRDLFDPAEGSGIAGQEEIQWRVLGTAIPATTFGMAVNAVPRISQEAGEERNFNMMNMKEQGQWPQVRLNSGLAGNWLHSDFRDVGLSYVLPMYEKIIDIGKFDQ